MKETLVDIVLYAVKSGNYVFDGGDRGERIWKGQVGDKLDLGDDQTFEVTEGDKMQYFVHDWNETGDTWVIQEEGFKEILLGTDLEREESIHTLTDLTYVGMLFEGPYSTARITKVSRAS